MLTRRRGRFTHRSQTIHLQTGRGAISLNDSVVGEFAGNHACLRNWRNDDAA